MQAVQLFLNLQNPLLAQECDPKWPHLAANLLILVVRILVEFSWCFRIIPPLTCSYAPWEFYISWHILDMGHAQCWWIPAFLRWNQQFPCSPHVLRVTFKPGFVSNMGVFRGGWNPMCFPWFVHGYFDGYPTGANPTLSCWYTKNIQKSKVAMVGFSSTNMNYKIS